MTLMRNTLLALDIFCLGCLLSPAHALTPADIEKDVPLASALCTDDDGQVLTCVLFLHDGKPLGAMVDEDGIKAIHDVETMEELWRRKLGTSI